MDDDKHCIFVNSRDLEEHDITTRKWGKILELCTNAKLEANGSGSFPPIVANIGHGNVNELQVRHSGDVILNMVRKPKGQKATLQDYQMFHGSLIRFVKDVANF